MTDGAVGAADGGMVEEGVAEVGSVAVTGAAGALVMVLRRVVAGRTVAVADEIVIELSILPVIDVVAGGAVGSVNAVVRFIFGVASDADWICSLVAAARVTGLAVYCGVAAHKREEAVVHTPFGEGDCVGIDGCFV